MVVTAPATSANLGPGFDCAAVALGLWNELEVTDGDGVEVEGEGAGELPESRDNLTVRAYALAESPAGKRFRFVNRIPLGSGLGSSAAAIALGLVAAAPDATAEELLGLGIGLESHADNLAAALAGGVTLTWAGRIARIAEALPLAPVAVIPRERTSTERSRASLPAAVPHADAAHSAGRAALLGAALAAGDADWMTAALDDRLHEPYRPSPLLDAIRAELPSGAAGATLSGSGPTVIVWAREPEPCVQALRQRFPTSLVIELAVAAQGALRGQTPAGSVPGVT
jgi:homoserine kinase